MVRLNDIIHYLNLIHINLLFHSLFSYCHIILKLISLKYDNIMIKLTIQYIWFDLLLQYSSYLLSSVWRLKVMGLSDSVLSCLPFIAGSLYLIDPLSVCIYSRTDSQIYACTEEVCCSCVALRHSIICIALLLSSRHRDTVSDSEDREVACDDKSQWEFKLSEIDLSK